MKGQREETDETIENYNKAQDVIDEYLRKAEEATYQLKYSYDQQIDDLSTTITSETNLLDERKKQWETTNLNILTGSDDLYKQLLTISQDPTLKTAWENQFEIEIEPVIEAALARIKAAVEGKGTYVTPVKKTPITDVIKTPISNFISDISDIREGKNVSPRRSRLPQFSRGIEHVPQTMLATVHRGESIVPAGKDTGGDNINVNISVTANVDTDYDVERLAAKLGESMQTQLASRTGKSKYRLR